MEPFLKQAARHYFATWDISSYCFVFPNRRAVAFFRKYLGEEVARAGKPLVAPLTYAMNEFFYEVAGRTMTDRVTLLLKLYESYKAVNPSPETLDEFIFWGGVLLSDFDDVDKYLADPSHLFTNVSDFKKLQDSYQYLSESQLKAIEQFAGHFRTGGKYKDEFRKIWDILLPLYEDFNARLEVEGMSYEGMVYRRLAERLEHESACDILSESFPSTVKFVFVGLNALNDCEKRLLTKLRNASLAEFCWDYSSTMIRDPHNKSSFFLESNVADYPQAFIPDAGEELPVPEINVLSVPSSVGQAKQLPEILGRLGAVGIETAVVLPDESLLLPVLNSIPEHIRDINVTMGYSIGGSELWSLMNDIASLQMHLREKDGKWFFYHRQVWSIFSNSVFKSVLDEEGKGVVSRIRSSAKYYIPQEDFCGDPLLEMVFSPVPVSPDTASEQTPVLLGTYQQEILSYLAERLKDEEGMAIEIEFAKEYWLSIGRLKACRPSILPATYFKLLGQLSSGISVPFLGEPLKGLQIMGPLETRALDFENLVVLSCNEGVFPRRSVASSFIPPELRKGFDLPTYEYQDAMWAYYFYRMIQRARRVWLLFDSRTEISRSGEESRFIKQLELHFGVSLGRYVAKADIERRDDSDSVPKTEEHLATIRGKYLSASAIQNYISCPAKFYYHTVCGLKADEEVAESLDASMLGTVFHETVEEIYRTRDGKVTAAYLKSMFKDAEGIRNRVRRHIMDALHSFEVTGRNIIFEELVCRYVRKVLEQDIALMKSYGTDEIRILGLELERYSEMGGFKFKGVIDRLDSLVDNEVRVVDYKTGRLDEEKVGMQLFLYDKFIGCDAAVKGKTLVNSVYHLASMFVSPVENAVPDDDFWEGMQARLDIVLAELADLSVDFKRCEDGDTCKWCDFKMICGR